MPTYIMDNIEEVAKFIREHPGSEKLKLVNQVADALGPWVQDALEAHKCRVEDQKTINWIVALAMLIQHELDEKVLGAGPRTRIIKAFEQLREDGYFAEPDWRCCQTCGVAAVPDEKGDRYVFFHEQDAENLQEHKRVLPLLGG
jgi:hypothetical protein